MEKIIHGVIFDMDGVLFDSEPVYDECTFNIMQRRGVSLTHHDLKDLRGLTSEFFWQRLVERHKLQVSAEELLKEETVALEHAFAFSSAVMPTPGIKELLLELGSRNIPIAVGTSSQRPRAEIILKRFGFYDLFKKVVTSAEVTQGKPHPDIFLLASNGLNINPKNCLVIEDSTNGMMAAKKAGMFAVGLLGPSNQDQSMEYADFVITHPIELWNAPCLFK